MLRKFHIDDTGEPKPGVGYPLSASCLPSADHENDHASHSIDGRGFIQITLDRVAGAVLVLNYKSVKPICLLGAITWLMKHSPQRVAVIDSASPNAVPQILRCKQAIDVLGRLSDERCAQPTYHRRTLNIAQSQFATRWEAAKEILNAGLEWEVQSHILSKLFQRHFIIAERDASSGHFLLAEAGAKILDYSDNIGPLQIGRPFTVLEDAGFGSWIADGLREFKVGDQPRVEYIDAKVRTKKSAKISWQRYSRLVVPYRRDNTDHIFTTAVMDSY